MRACLAQSQPEREAASTHFAAAVVAVVGPMFSSSLFILLGERILPVAVGAAVIFLIGTGSDAMVNALPPERRAFLLAQPETPDEAETDEDAAEDEEDDSPDALMERREAALPEWQQWGPGRVGEAIA